MLGWADVLIIHHVPQLDTTLPLLLNSAQSIPHPPQKNSWGVFYSKKWKMHLRQSWSACRSIFCLVLSKDFDSRLWQVFIGDTFCTAFKNMFLRSGWCLHPHSQEKVCTLGCARATPWFSDGTALPSSKTFTACGRGQKWAAEKASTQAGCLNWKKQSRYLVSAAWDADTCYLVAFLCELQKQGFKAVILETLVCAL